MISIQGKGVSSGVGVGPLYFYHRTKTEIPRYTVTDPDAEWHLSLIHISEPTRRS